MAYLQGQLNLPQNPSTAMPLLHHAAYLSSIEVPQPAYVYALLLAQEFPHVTLPQQLLLNLVPQAHPAQAENPALPPPTLMSESRKYLERSAYLNFGPALYKLGQSYEHALPPFPYDPLMSVQYYSLASQQGDALADLALSKWFLVGSKPDPNDPHAPAESFDKDESLALVFAEKAASRGEAGGEFAMGYYCEVGIGRRVDLNEAKVWYERAARRGHEDSKARLKELAKDNPKLLGAQEHQGRLERMRTNAKERMKASGVAPGAGADGLVPPMPGQPASGGLLAPSGANVMALARTSSRINHGGPARHTKMQDFEAANVANAAPAKVPERTEAPSTTTAPAATPPVAASTSAAGKTGAGGTGGKVKPTTFAEMGYHSSKIEDKECIIM
jgi:TPR repeat protein